MSLYIDFEPHSYYMGFAVLSNLKKIRGGETGYMIMPRWEAYDDDGNTYRVSELKADKLSELKQQIREYHLLAHDGYAERIARKRLDYLRGEIEREQISTAEIAELQSLAEYIDPGDVTLLEWAGVKEVIC